MRVEVHEDHVRAGRDALRRDVHEIGDPLRRPLAAPDGVRRVDADGQAREPLDDGHVREVHEVAVRVAEVRLHAAQAEDDLRVALGREVLGCVQRLVQRDPEAALHEDGEDRLPSHRLQELEVLDVARADLEHDARGAARLLETLGDLVDVALVGDLHRDHADAVLARLLEDPREAALPVALEGVGIRPGLVRAHARRRPAEGREGGEHRVGVLGRVHGAQPGKDVQVVLRELDAVVREAARAPVVLVPPDDAVLLRDADDALDARQDGDVLDGEAVRVADEVDLGDGLLGAADLVDLDLDAGQAREGVQQVLLGGGVLRGGFVDEDDHGAASGRRSTRPFFVVRAGYEPRTLRYGHSADSAATAREAESSPAAPSKST